MQPMARRMLLTIAVLSVVQLALASLFREKRDLMEKKEACMSPECLYLADVMRPLLYKQDDPCEDFYDYACVGLPKTGDSGIHDELYPKIIEFFDGHPEIVEPKNATEKIIMAYQVCTKSLLTDAQELDSIRKVLDEEGYGDWPLKNVNNTEKRTKFSSLEDVLRLIGINEIFDIFSGRDVEGDRTGVLLISVKQHRPYVDTKVVNSEATSEMEDHGKVSQEISMTYGPVGTEQEFRAIEGPCERFANGIFDLRKTTVETEIYSDITYRELEALAPSLQLLNLINSINKNKNVTLTHDDRLVIESPSLFKKTLQYLLDHDPHEVYTCYGLFRARTLLYLRSAALSMTNLFLDCRIQTLSLAPLLMTRLHAKSSKGIHQRQAVARYILNQVAKEYNTILQFAPWMDRATRSAALRKLWHMRPCVAFSENVVDDKIFDSTYEDVNIQRNNSFAEINSRFLRSKKQFPFKNLHKNVDFLECQYAYETMSASYYPLENEIAIMDGMLYTPFAMVGLPLLFPMAALGWLLGHEITHAFDSNGRLQDENGKLVNWWSNHTAEMFVEKANCFVEQYGKIVHPQLNITLDGRRTLAENIADNVGVRVAHRAYHANSVFSDVAIPEGLEAFTPDQLFFITLALSWCSVDAGESQFVWEYDPHAPTKYRINVAFQNMEEFSAAFHCKRGSPMRLTDRERCTLF